MKILFLIPYPLYQAPSQRFRFEQYLGSLSKRGHKLTFQSFLDSHNWQLFFKSGKPINKVFVLTKGFFQRLLIFFTIHNYEFVFIHREATPIGPPFVEWMIARIFKKKIIYDFDDAIWLTDRPNESWLLKTLKWRSKIGLICKWSYKVSCGNDYLVAYAKQFNTQVTYNPTTIDTEQLHNPLFYTKKKSNGIVIGWTGSHSTLKYLKPFENVLKQIESENSSIKVLVIADRPPELSLESLDFLPWSKDTEIKDLMKIDIGIMPLPNDEWANGKCGFKALQYMALGIPTIASPIGVNAKIIEHGRDGFLASPDGDWERILKQLITDNDLRNKIGLEARNKVIQRYSVVSNESNFLSLFE